MWATKREQAESFKLSRSPKSDEDFVAEGGYEPGSSKASLALMVRRIVAECGSVEPAFINHFEPAAVDSGATKS